jgi:F0F1-type ATP synthase gamma subunit
MVPMNRVRKISKAWTQARPYATQIKEHNRKVRNGLRQPKVRKPEGKI